MNDRLDDLLGAYALDAVDPAERAEIEAYLAVDPRARAEVDAHREVATMLSFGGGPAPVGLWERISSALDADHAVPPPLRLPPSLRLPPPDPALVPTVVPVPAPVAPVIPLRRRPVGRPLVGLAAAIALAVGVAGGLAGGLAVGRDSGRSAVSAADRYAAAAQEPGARRVELRLTDGDAAAAVVLPDGTGYLDSRPLATLPDGETYQLWAVTTSGRVISVGVLGNRPGVQAFTVGERPASLVVTKERTPEGVERSSEPAAYAGEV
ncbi:MAG: anti-sigma factor domain-containing protein [Acidimicrobiales bacterium]